MERERRVSCVMSAPCGQCRPFPGSPVLGGRAASGKGSKRPFSLLPEEPMTPVAGRPGSFDQAPPNRLALPPGRPEPTPGLGPAPRQDRPSRNSRPAPGSGRSMACPRLERSRLGARPLGVDRRPSHGLPAGAVMSRKAHACPWPCLAPGQDPLPPGPQDRCGYPVAAESRPTPSKRPAGRATRRGRRNTDGASPPPALGKMRCATWPTCYLATAWENR